MNSYLSMIPEQKNAVKSQYHCATLVGNWEEERRGFGPQEIPCDRDGKIYCTSVLHPPTSGGPKVPLEAGTIYTDSYKPLTAAQLEASKPSGSLVNEAPRELLFYHGDLAKPTEKNLLTIKEMSFTNHATDVPYTNEEILDMHGVSSRRDKTLALRRSMGLAAGSGSGVRAGNGGEAEEEEKNSAAIESESAYIRSLVRSNGDADATSSSSPSEDGGTADACGYAAPRMPPVGRVATRDALLTTKNVTIDATGEHLYTNLQPYPLTSSVCVGKMMASKNNPMHKTKLRVEYQLSK